MSTLPIAIQENMHKLDTPEAHLHAVAIIKGYFETFSADDAGDDLWQLLICILTTENVPHINLAEERKHWLHFYEYTRAVLVAVEKLYKDG